MQSEEKLAMKPAGATAYSDLISFIFENDMM